MYLAGCDFAQGKLQEARDILTSALAKEEPNELLRSAADDTFAAQMEFNIATTRSKKGFDYQLGHGHISSSLKRMEAALSKQLRTMQLASHQRLEQREAFHNYLGPDAVLTPLVIMSSFLSAKAETTLLSCPFSGSIKIQTGALVTSREEELDALGEALRLLDKAALTLLSKGRASNTAADYFNAKEMDAVQKELLVASSSSYSQRSLLLAAEPSLLPRQQVNVPSLFHSLRGPADSAAGMRSIEEDPELFTSATEESLTLRSELFPLEDGSSLTQVDYWIQWALNFGGIGLGFMFGGGHLEEGARLDAEQAKLISKVRLKLVDLLDAKSSPLDDGRRMQVLAALCKLSAQLRLLDDLFKYITKFERLSENYGDPFYQMMCARFRLDYGEWSDSYGASIDSVEEQVPRELKRLQVAKEYHRFAELNMDMHFRRDAVKRLMNCFIELSRLRHPVGVEIEMQQEQRFKEKSIERLTMFTAKEVDEKERSDMEWVKEFSYARSIQFATLLSKLR